MCFKYAFRKTILRNKLYLKMLSMLSLFICKTKYISNRLVLKLRFNNF